MTEATLLIAAVLLIMLSGLMSAIDAALSVSSQSDLVDYAAAGKNTRALATISEDVDTHTVSVNFVQVLAESVAAVCITVAFVLLFPQWWWAAIVAAVVLTGLSFVAIATSPRSVGRRRAQSLLTWSAPLVRALTVAFGPLARVLAWIAGKVTPGSDRRSFESEDQFLSLLDKAASDDLIEADDRDLVHSVFEFTDRIVRSIMVPRTEIVTAQATDTPREALTVFLERGMSRLPVIDGEVDDVVGVLYLKDLVQHALRAPSAQSTSVGSLARPPVFVPEQMRAETLLQQMKRDAIHVCLVVDEYGGIAGLVTLEDLIEELVGEISDEYDQPGYDAVELPDGRFRVSASTGLDEVSDLFDLDIEDQDVDSIGGLLGKLLGRVPQPGDTAQHDGLIITGGTSRGRGKGIATVFLTRTVALQTVDEIRGHHPTTGSIPLPTARNDAHE